MAAKSKTEKKTKKRKAQFDFPAPEAREVFLAGDFNNWEIDAAAMKKDKKGTWQINLSLEPGRYEYRIIVDGNWTNDPSCSCCVPNEFGSKNCVRVVE
jgi:1,4-alpha-glucan branching enzyme